MAELLPSLAQSVPGASVQEVTPGGGLDCFEGRTNRVRVVDQSAPRRRTNFGEGRWDRFSVACRARKSALFSVIVGREAIWPLWGFGGIGHYRGAGRPGGRPKPYRPRQPRGNGTAAPSAKRSAAAKIPKTTSADNPACVISLSKQIAARQQGVCGQSREFGRGTLPRSPSPIFFSHRQNIQVNHAE